MSTVTTISKTVEIPGIKISVHVEILNKAFEGPDVLVPAARDMVEEVVSVIENNLLVATQDMKPSDNLLNLLGLDND